MLIEKRLVGESFFKEVAMNGEGDRQVGAGLYGEVQVGLPCHGGRARVEHHDVGALIAGLLEERHQVDARHTGVHAPDDDHLRRRVVFVADRRHLAVEAKVGGAGWRRAHGAQQPRGAEPPEQDGIGVVLRHEAVRAAVTERQNRLCPVVLPGLAHLAGDQLQRIVPGDALELARALGAAPYRRIQQPVVAVDALVEAPHLGADVAVGDVVVVRPIDLRDAARAQCHVERAGVWAIERTRGLDVGFGGSCAWLGHSSLE